MSVSRDVRLITLMRLTSVAKIAFIASVCNVLFSERISRKSASAIICFRIRLIAICIKKQYHDEVEIEEADEGFIRKMQKVFRVC